MKRFIPCCAWLLSTTVWSPRAGGAMISLAHRRSLGVRTRCVSITPKAMEASSAAGEQSKSAIRILGGGLAGLSVAYHLLESSTHTLNITIRDVAVGPGLGGASAVAGGLLHPLSPRGKLVHWGLEGLAATNRLVAAAMKATPHESILLREELYRVAASPEQVAGLRQTASLHPQIAEWQDPTDPSLPFGALRLFNGCGVLHVPSYLRGLFAACQDEAARKGSSISWQPIASTPDDATTSATVGDDENWDLTVYCYGADMFERRHAKDSTSWFAPSPDGANTTRDRSVLPIQLVRGQSIEVQLTQPLPKALLCGKYISPVPHHPDRALIGATHEFQVEPWSKEQVVQELKERTMEFAPFCWEDGEIREGGDVSDAVPHRRIVQMTQGYRVQSARGKYGRRPIIGQWTTVTSDATNSDSQSPSSWIFTGLSSRGLLYHGLYGQLLSQAILQKDESILLQHCSDILWWKNIETGSNK